MADALFLWGMCFSYAINFSTQSLQTKLQLGDADALELPLPWENQPLLVDPGYFLSGFDRPTLPVVTANVPTPEMEDSSISLKLQPMRWGLIPHWCKSLEQAQELSLYGLNARAETVSQKPLFRDAWQSKPCLIPVSGFYEWQSIGKQKQPYFIHASDRQPLLMAGLYSCWLHAETGEEVQSYAILTTEANALMAEIHNLKKRMPVILSSEEAKRFLRESESQRTQYLKPCAEGLLEAYPVAKWLNQVKVNRNVASALEPMEKDFPQTLF